MWGVVERCRGQVREINARRNKGEDIELNEFCMIARDKKDTGKLIRAIGVYAMSPSLLPYYLIFWPGALPSTFDLPKQQEVKYLEAVACRVEGVLTALMGLDKEAIDPKNLVAAAHASALKSHAIKALSRCVHWRCMLACLALLLVLFLLPVSSEMRHVWP